MLCHLYFELQSSLLWGISGLDEVLKTCGSMGECWHFKIEQSHAVMIYLCQLTLEGTCVNVHTIPLGFIVPSPSSGRVHKRKGP